MAQYEVKSDVPPEYNNSFKDITINFCLPFPCVHCMHNCILKVVLASEVVTV